MYLYYRVLRVYSEIKICARLATFSKSKGFDVLWDSWHYSRLRSFIYRKVVFKRPSSTKYELCCKSYCVKTNCMFNFQFVARHTTFISF